MSLFILLIDHPDHINQTQKQLQPTLDQIDLPLRQAARARSVPQNENVSAGDGKPALVLLGPHLTNPLAAARLLHRQNPLAHLIFLTSGEDTGLAEQLKTPFAMIGSYWNIIDLAAKNGSSHLNQYLLEASQAARRRFQHRTTLNAINHQLASQPRADISELQRYRVSDRFLANILEHAQDAIIGANLDGRIITWNNAAEKLFDFPQDAAIGRPIASVAGGDWAAQLPQLISELHASPSGIHREELSYGRIDGRQVTIELMLSLVREESGSPIGISAVVRDITERRALEKRFHQAQKMESLASLAGGVAHDFNNILTTIQLSAGLSALHLPPGSEAARHIGNIQQAAIRAGGLANQMLAYSGKGHFLTETLDLNRLIEEMAAQLWENISNSAGLTFDFTYRLPPIEADPVQIRQVILNLIINASEAIGSQDGRITLSTGVALCDSHYLAQTQFNATIQPGRYVYFVVTDTGQGMDKGTQSKIFDPFFTTKFTGRGLGLAVVLGIVRGHKGAIDLQSSPGQGTAFKVLLPVSGSMAFKTAGQSPSKETPQESPQQAAPRQEALPLEGIPPQDTILFIDDEEHLRLLVRDILTMVGYQVQTAPDGRSGLQQFVQNQDSLALVILDLTMPDINGEQVFKQMQQINPAIPVILTSGYSEQEITNRFAGQNLSGFLPKPFNSQQLIAIVKQLLE